MYPNLQTNHTSRSKRDRREVWLFRCTRRARSGKQLAWVKTIRRIPAIAGSQPRLGPLEPGDKHVVIKPHFHVWLLSVFRQGRDVACQIVGKLADADHPVLVGIRRTA